MQSNWSDGTGGLNPTEVRGHAVQVNALFIGFKSFCCGFVQIRKVENLAPLSSSARDNTWCTLLHAGLALNGGDLLQQQQLQIQHLQATVHAIPGNDRRLLFAKNVISIIYYNAYVHLEQPLTYGVCPVGG